MELKPLDLPALIQSIAWLAIVALISGFAIKYRAHIVESFTSLRSKGGSVKFGSLEIQFKENRESQEAATLARLFVDSFSEKGWTQGMLEEFSERLDSEVLLSDHAIEAIRNILDPELIEPATEPLFSYMLRATLTEAMISDPPRINVSANIPALQGIFRFPQVFFPGMVHSDGGTVFVMLMVINRDDMAQMSATYIGSVIAALALIAQEKDPWRVLLGLVLVEGVQREAVLGDISYVLGPAITSGKLQIVFPRFDEAEMDRTYRKGVEAAILMRLKQHDPSGKMAAELEASMKAQSDHDAKNRGKGPSE